MIYKYELWIRGYYEKLLGLPCRSNVPVQLDGKPGRSDIDIVVEFPNYTLIVESGDLNKSVAENIRRVQEKFSPSRIRGAGYIPDKCKYRYIITNSREGTRHIHNRATIDAIRNAGYDIVRMEDFIVNECAPALFVSKSGTRDKRGSPPSGNEFIDLLDFLASRNLFSKLQKKQQEMGWT